MMNSLNLGFYSHINIDQGTLTEDQLRLELLNNHVTLKTGVDI